MSHVLWLKTGTSLQSQSIWEVGTSDAAAISCKELFLSTPKHSDFISEKDQGKDIIRCSGWLQPIYMSFINPPPFLVFDIPSTIKTLDILPH